MTEANQETLENPTQQHGVERKLVPLRFSQADKASTFITIMRHPDAPEAFNRNVVSQLQRWHLLEEQIDEDIYTDYEEFRKLTWLAEGNVEDGNTDFNIAFAEDPWNFDRSVEGEYGNVELEKFPRADELKGILGKKTKFLFRAEPGQFYLRLIVREDGTRQVLRTVDTVRSVEQINSDVSNIPDVIPNFEAVRFSDEKTGLLIDWVEGELPSGEDEKALCLTHAEELLTVPMDSYDLWAGNFVISQNSEGDRKPYYIDSDIIKIIAQKGLQPDTIEQRKPLFDTGKKKMK